METSKGTAILLASLATNQPLAASPPRLMVMKVMDSDADDDLVPRRNAHLAAKNNFRPRKARSSGEEGYDEEVRL